MKTFRYSFIALSAVILLALLFLSPEIAYYTPTNDVDIVIFLCITYGMLFATWCLFAGIAFLVKRLHSSRPYGFFMQRLMQIAEAIASNVWVPVLSVLMVLALLLHGLLGNHYDNAKYGFLVCHNEHEQSICDKHGHTIVEGKENFYNGYKLYLNSQSGEIEILRVAQYSELTSSKFVTTFDKEGHELKSIRIDFYSYADAEEKEIEMQDIAEAISSRFDENAPLSVILGADYIKEITELTNCEAKAGSDFTD